MTSGIFIGTYVSYVSYFFKSGEASPDIPDSSRIDRQTNNQRQSVFRGYTDCSFINQETLGNERPRFYAKNVCARSQNSCRTTLRSPTATSRGTATIASPCSAAIKPNSSFCTMS